MGFFSSIKNAVKKVASVVARPLGVAALAIPGVGAVAAGAVNAVGALAGGIKATADGVSSSASSMAGGLASGAVSGYASTAASTVNPVTGETLAQSQSSRLMLWGMVLVGLVTIPAFFRPRSGRR